VNEPRQIFKKGELCRDEQGNLMNSHGCLDSKKILVITQNVLVPTQLGCDKRAFYVLEALVGLGHDVHLAALLQSSLHPTQLDRDYVDQLQISVYSKPIMRRAEPVSEYRHMLAIIDPDIVIMWLWFWTFDITAPGILLQPTREALPGSSIIVFSDDVHYIRERQLAQYQRTPDQRARVLKRALRMQTEESKIYKACDLIMVITDSDRRDVVDNYLGLEDKVLSARYVVGPWDVPVTPSNSILHLTSRLAVEHRSGLIFVGNGNNPTNIIAMRWYVENAAKSMWEVLPDVRLVCVGNYWRKFLENVPNASKYVQFTGYLSEKAMDKLLDTSRVFVSPIVASTGINTKNVLALSKGIPLVTMAPGSKGLCRNCVHTALTNETRTCSNNNNEYLEKDLYVRVENSTIPFLVAKDVCEFVSKVALLYNNDHIWRSYSRAGPEHVMEWFDRTAGADDIAEMLYTLHS